MLGYNAKFDRRDGFSTVYQNVHRTGFGHTMRHPQEGITVVGGSRSRQLHGRRDRRCAVKNNHVGSVADQRERRRRQHRIAATRHTHTEGIHIRRDVESSHRCTIGQIAGDVIRTRDDIHTTGTGNCMNQAHPRCTERDRGEVVYENVELGRVNR